MEGQHNGAVHSMLITCNVRQNAMVQDTQSMKRSLFIYTASEQHFLIHTRLAARVTLLLISDIRSMIPQHLPYFSHVGL